MRHRGSGTICEGCQALSLRHLIVHAVGLHRVASCAMFHVLRMPAVAGASPDSAGADIRLFKPSSLVRFAPQLEQSLRRVTMSAVFDTFRMPPQIGVSPHFITYNGPKPPKPRRASKQHPSCATSQQTEVDKRSVDICPDPDSGGGQPNIHGQPGGADTNFSPALLEAILDDLTNDSSTSAANLDGLWADEPANRSKAISSANQSARDITPDADDADVGSPEASRDEGRRTEAMSCLY